MKNFYILLLITMVLLSGCSKASQTGSAVEANGAATAASAASAEPSSSNVFVYIPYMSGRIDSYRLDNGKMTKTGEVRVGWPGPPTADPSGKYLYIADDKGIITRFAIGADGALTNPVSFKPNLSNQIVHDLVLSPSGKFIYAALASEGVPGTIALIPVAKDGSLAASEVKYCGAGRSSNSVAMSPSGGFVYVSHVVGGGGISGFRVAAGDLLQVLAEDATTAAVGSFTEMAVSQDSKYLFACDVAENSIKCFGIDSTGKLTFIARAAYPEGYDTGSVKNIATDRYGNVLTATQGRQLMVYRLDNNQLKRVASYMCLKSGQFLQESEVEDQLSQTPEYQKALERRSAMDEEDRNRYAMMEAKHKLCSQISSVKTTAEDDVYAASTSGIYRFRSVEAGLTFLSAALTWPDTLEQSRNRNTPQTERAALTQIKGGLVIWLGK